MSVAAKIVAINPARDTFENKNLSEWNGLSPNKPYE
jgi:hypothetical protein